MTLMELTDLLDAWAETPSSTQDMLRSLFGTSHGPMLWAMLRDYSPSELKAAIPFLEKVEEVGDLITDDVAEEATDLIAAIQDHLEPSSTDEEIREMLAEEKLDRIREGTDT